MDFEPLKRAYRTLGLEVGTPMEQVERYFWDEIGPLYHPEVAGPSSNDSFSRLFAAYELLCEVGEHVQVQIGMQFPDLIEGGFSVVILAFKRLGAEFGAPVKGIKKKFRKLAHKLHPDVSEGDRSEEFKEVNTAYELLCATWEVLEGLSEDDLVVGDEVYQGAVHQGSPQGAAYQEEAWNELWGEEDPDPDERVIDHGLSVGDRLRVLSMKLDGEMAPSGALGEAVLQLADDGLGSMSGYVFWITFREPWDHPCGSDLSMEVELDGEFGMVDARILSRTQDKLGKLSGMGFEPVIVLGS